MFMYINTGKLEDTYNYFECARKKFNSKAWPGSFQSSASWPHF